MINIKGHIQDYEQAVKQRIELCFPNGLSSSNKFYIYGYGMMGEFVYKKLKDRINFNGYIDKNKKECVELSSNDRIKIYSLEEVDKSSYIIIASLMYWSEIYEECLNKGYEHCCHYEELAFYDHTIPHWDRSFDGMAISILNNRKKFLQIYNMLYDEKSKQVFENVISFRLTMNIHFTQEAYKLSVLDNQKQYFDYNIVQVDNNEVFVDCGGYCGETTNEFIKFVDDYHRIYFFEPDKNILDIAKKNLQKHKEIYFFPYGVGIEEKMSSFNAVGDASGNFCSDGNNLVKIVKLDEIIPEKVSFIKMDIEGMEKEAIIGSEKIIKKYKPKLAISVYHRCNDIWSIAEQILKFRKDYKLYMRHYTEGCADTVMYFI